MCRCQIFLWLRLKNMFWAQILLHFFHKPSFVLSEAQYVNGTEFQPKIKLKIKKIIIVKATFQLQYFSPVEVVFFPELIGKFRFFYRNETVPHIIALVLEKNIKLSIAERVCLWNFARKYLFIIEATKILKFFQSSIWAVNIHAKYTLVFKLSSEAFTLLEKTWQCDIPGIDNQYYLVSYQLQFLKNSISWKKLEIT